MSADDAVDVLGVALDLDRIAQLLEQLARRRHAEDLEVRRGGVLREHLDVRDAQDPVGQVLPVADIAAAPQLQDVDPAMGDAPAVPTDG